MAFEVCRICLASNTKMYSITNTELQDIFEKLTSKQWNTNRRPSVICYICHAHLKSCQKFMEYSRLSEKIFTQIFTYTEMEFTEDTVAMLNSRRLRKLSMCLIDALSINISSKCEIKDESEIIELSEQLEVKEEKDSSSSINDYMEANHSSSEQENVLPNVVAPKFGTQKRDRQKKSRGNIDTHENTAIASEDTKVDNQSLNVSNGEPKKNPYFILKFDFNHSKYKKRISLEPSTVPSKSSKPESLDNLSNSHTTQQNKMKKQLIIHHKKSYDNHIIMKTQSINQTSNDNRMKNLEKSYICDVCNQRFFKESYLNNHVKIHRGPPRPYRCKFCDMKFRQLTHLVQHHRTHTGERPYSCLECPKKFRQLSNLKQHQRIHSGEKPYICKLCDKDFHQVANLNKHMEVHHSRKM